MTGNEAPARTHGQKLSILLALASSIAHALPGVAKMAEAGLDGLPGWIDEPGNLSFGMSDGDRIGEENDRR